MNCPRCCQNSSPRRSHLAKDEAASVKLAKGKKLDFTDIRNEHAEISLKQEDARRWRMAENLLTEHVLAKV